MKSFYYITFGNFLLIHFFFFFFFFLRDDDDDVEISLLKEEEPHSPLQKYSDENLDKENLSTINLYPDEKNSLPESSSTSPQEKSKSVCIFYTWIQILMHLCYEWFGQIFFPTTIYLSY